MISKKCLSKQSKKYLPRSRYNLDVESLLWVPAGLAVFWKDLEGRYLGCNDVPAATLGLKSRHEITNLTDFDLPMLHEEAKTIRQGDYVVLNSQKPSQFNYSITNNDRVINIRTFKAPMYDENGSLAGVYGIDNILNINDLKSALNFVSDPALTKENINFSENYKLTKRQEECLLCLVQGMTVKKIARTLNLSPRTVEHYLENIKNKLHCHSRDELIKKALQMPFVKNNINKYL